MEVALVPLLTAVFQVVPEPSQALVWLARSLHGSLPEVVLATLPTALTVGTFCRF